MNVVTDASGNVYRQYYYDPYGNVIKVLDGSGATVDINNDSGFNNAYTYRGYRYDPESGLYFLNARYYAAGIGRFLTKDDEGHLKDPQSLNRYAYAEGDPVNNIDPSGHGILSFLQNVWSEVENAVSEAVDTVSSWFAGSSDGESIMFADKSQKERPDTGLSDKSNEEISNGARDRSLPGKERKRYQKEEKIRGLRDQQKRQSVYGAPKPDPTLATAGLYAYIAISNYSTNVNNTLNTIFSKNDQASTGMAAGLGGAATGGVYVLVP